MDITDFSKGTLSRFRKSAVKLSIDLSTSVCMRDQVAIISDVSGVDRDHVVQTLQALSTSIYFQLLNGLSPCVKIDGLGTFERVLRKPRQPGKRVTRKGDVIAIKSQPAKFDVVTHPDKKLSSTQFNVLSVCDKKLKKEISKQPPSEHSLSN
jgi:nucleoid DNA-binding protein